MQPSVGRIVHYLEGEGATCAALIVKVHEQADPQLRYLDAPVLTDPEGEALDLVIARDSDGEPIYEPGTEDGDVALDVFRPDGTMIHVPSASQWEGEDDEAQKVGTWAWPPRI